MKLKEKPRLSILRMMMDMNRDDEDVARSLRKLEEYETEMNECRGERDVLYEQKVVVGDDLCYGGARKLGRAYTRSLLNWFPRKIVNTLYKASHVELDMVNAQPTMLYNAFASHLDIDALGCYVRDPEAIRDGFRREFRMSKKDVKVAINAVIASHPKTVWDFGLDGDMDKVRVFAEHPFVRGLKDDLDRMAKTMRELYPEFMDAMHERAREQGKLDRVDGLAFTYLAADMEHCVMRRVIEWLGADNDMVWYFDGVIIPEKLLAGKTFQVFTREVSNHVQEAMGMEVSFHIKSLQENSLAWSMPLEEVVHCDEYNVWKHTFEKSWARLTTPPKFMLFAGEGYHLLDRMGFNHVTMAEKPEFIKRWLADPSKRQYIGIEFAPPPLVSRAGHFNTWLGFAAEEMEPIDDADEVMRRCELYQWHVQLLMGDDSQYTDYFHKLMAYKIQNPGYNWGVMPFIRSTQGVGKDQWFKFISYIVGTKYCLSVTNISDVMGRNSGLIENKLFVSFSEVAYDDSKRHEEDLKKLITDNRMVVERKYVPQYENRMTSCLLAFSNNYGALRISADERRFFCVTASGLYANVPAYHRPFHEYINEPKNQRAVYQWLRDYPLGDFNPMNDRPITNTFVEMAEATKPVMDSFMMERFDNYVQAARMHSDFDLAMVGDGLLKMSASHLWDEFGSFIAELKIASFDSRSKIEKFGARQLAELKSRLERHQVIQGRKVVENPRSKNCRFWVFDIQAMKNYLSFLKNQDDD